MQFLVIAKVLEGTSTQQISPLVKLEAAKVWEYIAFLSKHEVHLETSPLTPLLIKERGKKQTVSQLLDKRYISNHK